MKETSLPIYLSGRPFTADDLAQVCETVEMCAGLTWHELLQTICEHLGWVTPTGRYKVASCATALRHLAQAGRVHLPAVKVGPGARPGGDVVVDAATDPEPLVTGTVRTIAPVAVVPVRAAAERRRWNAYVARYHPQGYRRPFGAHLRYFVVGAGERRLGCVLFAASAWALADRDQWIGWSGRDRAQRLPLVVANTRFVLFPWVRVKYLASTALSLAAKRIRSDWAQRYGYAPVLLETFVDPAHYQGTCYQAANWIEVGVTTGRGRTDRHRQYLSTPRRIYVLPLVPGWRSVLRGESDESLARSGGGVESGSKRGAASAPATAGRASGEAPRHGDAGQRRQPVEDPRGRAGGAARRG